MQLLIRASGAVTLQLGGLPFSVSLGVPQQQYQHIVATLPVPVLNKLKQSGALEEEPGMGEEVEEEEEEVEEEEEEGGGAAGGGADSTSDEGEGGSGRRKRRGRPTPQAFVIAGPVAHVLSVVPDLEAMLGTVDNEAGDAVGVSLGGGVTATSHLVKAYKALGVGAGSVLMTAKRAGERARSESVTSAVST